VHKASSLSREQSDRFSECMVARYGLRRENATKQEKEREREREREKEEAERKEREREMTAKRERERKKKERERKQNNREFEREDKNSEMREREKKKEQHRPGTHQSTQQHRKKSHSHLTIGALPTCSDPGEVDNSERKAESRPAFVVGFSRVPCEREVYPGFDRDPVVPTTEPN
jgi:hypothetical protein